MQQLTEQIIRLSPPGGLFDQTVVGNLFADASPGARKQLIHRATRAGEILRLKRGTVYIGQSVPQVRTPPLCPCSRAACPLAYQPRNRPLALRSHSRSCLPDQQRYHCAESDRFNPLGIFSFDRVPSPHPRAGVEATQLEGGEWAFIASPLRAIADAVYLHREISWKRDGLSYCTESLRIEEDDLAQISFAHSEEICAAVRNRRTRAFLEGLEKAMNHVS